MPIAQPTAISSPPETRFISRIPLAVASLCLAAAAAGTVLNQNPAAGEQVASDVTITLTISGGPPPTTSTPPPSSPPTSSPASPTG